MKLFFAPGTCALAPHIVLHELGIPHDSQKVNLQTKELDGGGDYRAINAKGYVPALQLDNGELLTEGPAIMQYLADMAADNHGLLAPCGQLARYHTVEWLNFISSEMHKNYGALFNPHGSDEMRAQAYSTLKKRYEYTEAQLAGKEYLTGSQYTLADVFFYVVTDWAGHVKFDLAPFPQVRALHARVAARPAVQAARQHQR
ncbi:glutathione transferase GstA [Massilia arenosa]|uniref:Glutathione transferase GstA n=1 Tax=Zemynaea arenosa TaxID=2561931 RepID=A0A4Y9SBV3_9BURK|nr:glutathione transferase GstA [Massilia arenosa]TFW19731.1 glutathione transferase GstA [Massilia arenosa]